MITYQITPQGHAVISENGKRIFDVEFSYATTPREKTLQIAKMVDILGSANSGRASNPEQINAKPSWRDAMVRGVKK